MTPVKYLRTKYLRTRQRYRVQEAKKKKIDRIEKTGLEPKKATEQR